MPVTLHDTWASRDLLRELRRSLDGADEALLCVAFASAAGVHLLERQLDRLGDRARIVATTVFGGGSALDDAAALGARVRILNPGGGTYHPKLYLTRGGAGATALVGSANLTSGLVGNVEVGVGLADAPALTGRAWALGESLWEHPRAVDHVPGTPGTGEPMAPDLFRLVRARVRPGAPCRRSPGAGRTASSRWSAPPSTSRPSPRRPRARPRSACRRG